MLPENHAPKSRRKFYALSAGILIIVIVAAGVLLLPQDSSTFSLNLVYNVGEHMVYDTTNTVTNQVANTSLNMAPVTTNSQSINSTTTIDVIASNSQNYILNETIRSFPDLIGKLFPFTVNVSKTSSYNNFIAPGGPQIFYNASNPTILAYLAQQTVKAGDVWTIPVNIGNASLGLTGEVTLKFEGPQDITVPAGTYKTMRIEVESNTLSYHSDGTGIISIPQGTTLQLNGTTYLEQGTCLLIKADLTQITVTNATGVNSTSTIYTEKTLMEYTTP